MMHGNKARDAGSLPREEAVMCMQPAQQAPERRVH